MQLKFTCYFWSPFRKTRPTKRFDKKFFYRVAKIKSSITFALPFGGRVLNRKDLAANEDSKKVKLLEFTD